MAVRNIRIEPKSERKKHENYDVWTESSDITTFNLYDQDWQTIEELGMSEYFNDKADFERKKSERKSMESCGA